MAFNLTPGQYSRRADFYHQLAQLTGVGLGVTRGLQQLMQHPPSRAYVDPIRQLLTNLGHGYTFSESLRLAGDWVPEFDVALLHAGEHSGRLDACFRLLADYYAERAALIRQILTDMAYPLFLMHLAIFILPFAQAFVSNDWFGYALRTLGLLIPFYLVVFAVIFATQSRHGETWRSLIEIITHPIPLLGGGRRALALSRLAAALEALLNAGVTIIEAWDLAAAACGSPALKRTVNSWRPGLQSGETPAEAVAASGVFPEVFVARYTTGEISGQLDESLRQLRDYYREEGTRKIRAVAKWAPRAVYLMVALYIAYRVVSFWSGYFKQIGAAGGF